MSDKSFSKRQGYNKERRRHNRAIGLCSCGNYRYWDGTTQFKQCEKCLESNRRRKQRLNVQAKCTACATPQPKGKPCPKCAQRRQLLKSKGLCPSCKKKTQSQNVYCEKCLEKVRFSYKKRIWIKGTCPTCGCRSPKERISRFGKPFVSCQVCLDRGRERAKKRYWIKKEAKKGR